MAGNNSYCQADADAIFLNVSSDGDNCSLTPYQVCAYSMPAAAAATTLFTLQAGVLDTLAAVRLITSLLGLVNLVNV